MKLESLTKEQEKQLTTYRDKWLEIGLSTEPTNEDLAIKGINEAYLTAGLKPPKKVIFLDSPLLAIKQNMLLDATADYSARNLVETSVETSVRNSVYNLVETSLRDLIFDSLWTPVWASVWDSVRPSVWASVWNLDHNLILKGCIYGQHYAHSLGVYNFYDEICNIPQCHKLQPLIDIAKQANWWFPRRYTAIVSRKPTICKVNSLMLLDLENGPAIKFADGFCVYKN